MMKDKYYENCFAYQEVKRYVTCTALDKLYCVQDRTKRCPFYQSVAGRVDKLERIREIQEREKYNESKHT